MTETGEHGVSLMVCSMTERKHNNETEVNLNYKNLQYNCPVYGVKVKLFVALFIILFQLLAVTALLLYVGER